MSASVTKHAKSFDLCSLWPGFGDRRVWVKKELGDFLRVRGFCAHVIVRTLWYFGIWRSCFGTSTGLLMFGVARTQVFKGGCPRTGQPTPL
ncbi:hypothetical protein QC764_116493 [Podospora pseudoanserina]|uniref:Uncharacterized protein n=1 Tax=Podospora pseudoanserina TaxID=2609844 RepID=A0ABR0IQ10_9PEZI|nr:hypothetical protein QC764_116493 [Podospora pseudoanserina]